MMVGFRGVVDGLAHVSRRKLYFSIVPAVVFGVVDVCAQFASGDRKSVV
jgi:hypothetical protein